MKSTVWFASLRARSGEESTEAKVRRLFEAAGFPSCIRARDRTAIKLHFGERGNDSFISPVYVRQVVEKIKEAGALPFVTDTISWPRFLTIAVATTRLISLSSTSRIS